MSQSRNPVLGRGLETFVTSCLAAFTGTAAFRVSVPAVAYHVREELGGAMVEV